MDAVKSAANGQAPLVAPGSQAPSTNVDGTEVTQNGVTTGVTPDSSPHKSTWECVEEIVQLLKTAFPLLTLSLETIVDQLITRFKQNPEENIYHHIVLLLGDAMQVSFEPLHVDDLLTLVQNYTLKMNSSDDDGQMTAQTILTLQRMAQGLVGQTKVFMLSGL